MNKLNIIYDFDGTLTPYNIPHYKVLEDLGYDELHLTKEVKKLMKARRYNTYDAYTKVIFSILSKNNIKLTNENIIKGSSSLTFNQGVEDYFLELSNLNVTNFLLSSGFEIYLKNTLLTKYFKNIYGTTFNYEDELIISVKELVTDEFKVKLIKKIIKENKIEASSLIYMGDGLTDVPAMEYVKKVGGTTIFISKTKNDVEVFNKLKKLGIADEIFTPDFSINGQLFIYIMNKLKR
ncbi:MAG: haloacid dehalogenase-like hydrolase [Bacilli bacterium]